jgi:hypothetical protein
MGMTPEGRIKKLLDTMLKTRKLWYFSPQGGAFGRSGVPDKIVCVRGHFVGVEVKANRHKLPTALQAQCMAKIEAAGGKCFVVYDVETVAMVEEYIDACR